MELWIAKDVGGSVYLYDSEPVWNERLQLFEAGSADYMYMNPQVNACIGSRFPEGQKAKVVRWLPLENEMEYQVKVVIKQEAK